MSRILIIEDDPAALALERDVLRGAGHTVDTADGGEEGRKIIEKTRPELLVLDLSLYDDFGLDICRDIKRDYPGILVVMLTALGTSMDVVAGIEAGADDYLAKPFNPREFVARVQMTLEKAGKK